MKEYRSIGTVVLEYRSIESTIPEVYVNAIWERESGESIIVTMMFR